MCVVVLLRTCQVETLSSYDPKRIIKQTKTPYFYLHKACVKRFTLIVRFKITILLK